MDELVQWLRAQLDEDERIARAAAEPEQWVELNRAPQTSWSVDRWADPDRAAVVAEESSAYPVVATTQGMDEADAEARVAHIAEHDPARVLREIDAKRRILTRHSPHVSGSTGCAARCEQGHPGVPVCNHDGYRWPCPDVRDQADVYAARPGFREEWRP